MRRNTSTASPSTGLHKGRRVERGAWLSWRTVTVVAAALAVVCLFALMPIMSKDDPSPISQKPAATATTQAPAILSVPRHVLRSVCNTGSRSNQLLVLAIGDSITYGNGSHVRRKERDHEGNYPIALQARLVDACKVVSPRLSIKVHNLGHSGRTLVDGFKQSYRNSSVYHQAVGILRENREPGAAIVAVFMLGTNDSKLRHWRGRIAFENAMVALVSEFIALHPRSGMMCVLMTPPPSYPNPRSWARRGASTRFHNAPVLGNIRPSIIRQEIRMGTMNAAERLGCSVVDLYGEIESAVNAAVEASSEELQEEATAEVLRVDEVVDVERAIDASNAAGVSHLFHDGVHPTVVGHELIADLVAHALLSP